MEDVKTIWLTGATSGIGRAMAARFVREGKQVALTSRSVDALDALAAELIASDQALVFPTDVSDDAAVTATYAAVKNAMGVPDMVIANAGTHINMPAGEITMAGCRSLIEINLLGGLATLLAPLPDMLERGSGHLVGVGSLSSYRGLPLAAAYGASKAGLNNFLQSLRFDVETHGLKVTAVNPGFVKTPLTDRNTYPMPFIISAEKATDYIWDGLEKGKMEIHFPPAFSWTCKLLRILPYGLYHALVRRFTGSAGRKG